MANPQEDKVTQYLQALTRQANIVKDEIGEVNFAQLAIGGGTPSFLDETQLENLFLVLENVMGAKPGLIPVSFEVSPKTITKSKLEILHSRGVDRISIGIQSFLEQESKLLGRPQRNTEVYHALEQIKAQNFATLNIDLIYGGAEQTRESWAKTLAITLQFSPEEIYLYPLYVRPLTGLDKMGMNWDNFRLQLYRQGREYLLENGYEQVSMRMFRKMHQAPSIKNNLTYCCQEDGMLGLGSGARSYTDNIHYSTEYAVGRKSVVDIISSYTRESDENFGKVHFGISLTEEDRKRRYVIKSLLHSGGLDADQYFQRFASDVASDFSELEMLIDSQLASIDSSRTVKLTPAGVELSDSIGPALYSENINYLMQTYQLR